MTVAAGMFAGSAPAQDFNSALNNSELTFTAIGPWESLGYGGADGAGCARCWPSGPGDLRTTVTGPDWVVYWKKKTSGGEASVLVDGTAAETWEQYQSDFSWIQRVLPIPAGSHEVTWRANAGCILLLDRVSVEASLTRPLDVALPGFVWNTGGDVAWDGVVYPVTMPGIGRGASSLTYAPAIQHSWIETSVTGPGRLDWQCGGNGGTHSRITFLVNDIIQFRDSTSHTPAAVPPVFLPPGNHMLRWLHERPAGSGTVSTTAEAWLERVRFTPGITRSLSDALDAPALTFSTGGDAPWLAVQVPADGTFAAVDSAASGLIPFGGVSWIETTVEGPGILTSIGTVPADINSPDMRISVDGTDLTNSDRFSEAIEISPGSHTVGWRVFRPQEQGLDTGEVVRQGLLHSVNWQPESQVTFSDALDVEGISFSSSSPETDVYGRQNANPAGDDGVYLRNGGALTGNLTGPGVLLWTRAGDLDCYLDGLKVRTSLSASNLAPGSIEIPPGVHELRWVTPHSGLFALIYTITFEPASVAPLAEALGNPALVWQASPEVTAFSNRDGVASFLLPVAASESRLYGMETSVTGPGVFTLTWTNRGGSRLQCRIDGVVWDTLWPASGQEWVTEEIPLPAGNHTFGLTSASVPNGQAATPGMDLIKEASWRSQTTVSLSEALDAPGLTFTTGGSAALWQGVGGDGEDRARVSQLPAGSSAWIDSSVTGPGLLRFRSWATQPYFGHWSSTLSLLIDGVTNSLTSDKPVSFQLAPGAHALRWIHSPIAGGASRMAALDAVSFTAYQPQPAATWAAGAGFSLTFSGQPWITATAPDFDGGGCLHAMPSTTPWLDSPWLEGRFTGPGAVEFAILTFGETNVVNIFVDGGERQLTTGDYPVPNDWQVYRAFIGAGDHTIRWMLPSGNTAAFFDGLRLVPSTGTISEAGEFPPGASADIEGRTWLPFSDPSLPDGDAVFCEGGFNSFGGWQNLTVPLTGPALVRFHAKATTRPLTWMGDPFTWVGGYNISPASWQSMADGWELATFEIPPGQHILTILPEDRDTVIVDRMTIQQWDTWAPDEILDIPGAVFRTSPDNPFVGFSTGGSFPTDFYGSAIPGGPETWLEMDCQGPGIVRFTADIPAFNYAINPDRFIVEVDGAPLPLSRLHYPPPPFPIAVCVPSGLHTVRWTVRVPATSPYSITCRLGDISLTATPQLAAFPQGESAVFAASEFAPLSIYTESGTPVIRFTGPGEEGWQPTPLFAWKAQHPGILRFRWRHVPGSLPGESPFPGIVQIYHPSVLSIWGDPEPAWSRALTDETSWQDAVLAYPLPNADFVWYLRPSTGAMELSGFDFTPCEPVPLTEVISDPGITAVSSGTTWSGLRDPDGRKFILPAFSSWGYPGPLEVTVTGPVELQWRESRLNPADGEPWPYSVARIQNSWDESSPVRIDPPGPPFDLSFAVPPGTHQIPIYVSDYVPAGSYSRPVTVLENFTVLPASAAYLAWRPLWEGEPSTWSLPSAADWDRDGQPNIMEYTFRTDPFIANAPPQPVSSFEDGQLTVTLPEPRPLTDGVRVILETSPDMAAWSPAGAEPVAPAPAGHIKFRLPAPAAAGARLYVRARVAFALE